MSSDVVSVGDRLRVAREKGGLSQEDLANAAGVNRASISQYERGITDLNPYKSKHRNLVKVAARLLRIDEASIWGDELPPEVTLVRESPRAYSQAHAPAPSRTIIDSLLDIIEGPGHSAEAKKQARQAIHDWFASLSPPGPRP